MNATQILKSSQPGGKGGCLKCGELGHWARDCQAPRDKQIAYQQERKKKQAEDVLGVGSLPGGGNDDENVFPSNNNNKTNDTTNMTAAQAQKEKRKRPKLTMEMIKQSNGLPEVYHNFPDIFRASFGGKGHEASDLRRLLEMYKRWQDRIFPHGSFDNFIYQLEKIGATNMMKKEMSDMRVDFLKPVEEEMDRFYGSGGDGGEQIGTEGKDGLGDMLNDDELVQLAMGWDGDAGGDDGDGDEGGGGFMLRGNDDGGGNDGEHGGAWEDMEDEELLKLLDGE